MSAHFGAWSKSIVAGLVGLVLVVGGVVTTPAMADTAPLNPANPATPATVTADPLPTAQINGVAWAQVVVGNTVYVAGRFSRVRPAGAAPGTQETVRNNLLAYDIRTGALITSFAPSLDSQALAIAASPDGSRIYVGGDFTYANGQPRNRIAAYDTRTGQLISTFRPAVNNTVRALAATDTTVYLGGEFSAVGTAARPRLAAVSAADGALLPWAPQPGAGSTSGNKLPNSPTTNATPSSSVLAMVLAGPGQLVVAGRFDYLNGVKATGVGALDATTGATRPFAVNSLITNHGINSAIWSLSTDGTDVYGTGYNYYGPGNLEGSFAAAANGGALRWINECHGDTYSSFPRNGVLYQATHAHVCSNIGSFPEQNPQLNLYGTAVSLAATGTVGTATLANQNFAGKPAPSVLPWFPTFYAGAYTGQYQAGWSVTGNQDYVVYAGEFPAVNAAEQQGLVRFATTALAPNKVGPRASGTFAPTVDMIPGAVRISWKAVHDRDNENITYLVYRDSRTGTPACQVTRPSQWWNLSTYSCLDTGATAGSHRYFVVASDPAWNEIASSWTTATVGATNSGATSRPYGQLVARDGATGHWPLSETSGSTAHDRTGVQNMSINAGVTRGSDGAINGDADKAFSFNGSSSGFLASATAAPAPQTFSVEAWFATTSRRGGKIVGFGNARTGQSSQYDRHVYMDTGGRIHFGVYNGGQRVVSTGNSFNDGQWHHVVGSMSSAGLVLYVDGQLVGTRADVRSANPYNGFWRVGGDSPWSGSAWFEGRIDEVAVYPAALSAAQVADHTQTGRTGQAPNVVPTASFTTATSDLTATFDAAASADSDGRLTGYAWDFGDGTTGEGARATHTYVAGGTYTVRLTVTDDRNGTATTTREVSVVAPPVGPGSIAADTFGRDVASGWGEAETGGAWTTIGAAGDLSVTGGSGRLTAAPGTTSGALLDVSARDVALQADVALDHAPTGAGSWVTLGSRLVGGTKYSAQAFFAADGRVQVNLVRTVNWAETWLAGITLPQRYTPGTALTLRFEADGTAPTALRAKAWTAGSAEPAAWQVEATDATAALQRAGDLRVDVYNARSATASSDVRIDNLRAEPAGTVVEQPEPAPNAAPTAAFTATPADLTAAFDGSGSSDTDGRIVGHAWDFGDGDAGTGATASHTYDAAGTYQVRLTVTDDKGATGTVTRAVTVTAPATPPPAEEPPADPPLAADAFGREVAGDFGPADTGGTWTTYGGAANVQVTEGSGRLTAAPATSSGGELGIAAQDVAVQVDVVLDRAPTGGGSYFSLGTRNVGGTRYKTQLWFAADGTVQLHLVRVVNWSEAWLQGITLPGRYTPGTAITVRLDVSGSGSTSLKAKAWTQGATEPADWQVRATDTTASLQRAGGLRLDLYTAKSSTGSATARVDHLWAGAAGKTPPTP